MGMAPLVPICAGLTRAHFSLMRTPHTAPISELCTAVCDEIQASRDATGADYMELRTAPMDCSITEKKGGYHSYSPFWNSRLFACSMPRSTSVGPMAPHEHALFTSVNLHGLQRRLLFLHLSGLKISLPRLLLMNTHFLRGSRALFP